MDDDKDVALGILLKLLDKRPEGPWVNDSAAIVAEYRAILELVKAPHREGEGLFAKLEKYNNP